MKLVVKRAPEADVVEWVEEAPTSQRNVYRAQPVDADAVRAQSIPTGPVGMGKPPLALWLVVGTIVLLSVGAMFLSRPKQVELTTAPRATVGDIAPVHAGVKLGEEDIRAPRRIERDQRVETDPTGRARIRLDGGTTLLLDGGAAVSSLGPKPRIERGRVFVEAFEATTLRVATKGDAELVISASNVAIDLRGDTPAIYAAKGDATLRVGGVEKALHEGDTARIEGSEVKIAPEKGFDDWTFGLAAPWSVMGPARRGIADVWGRNRPGDPGSPLTVRSVEVKAEVHGEMAETRIATTFFNASERAVVADLRLALPASGIVSDFSTTRDGQTTSATLALAKRGARSKFDLDAYAHRGDLLEWAGDGWVRGTVASVGPGQVVTATVTYVEWLAPVRTAQGTRRITYRLPLVGEGDPPLVGDFSARVDLADAAPISLSASSGAEVKGVEVVFRASEFRPRADLVVEAETRAPDAPARAFFTSNDGTVLFRTDLPEGDAKAQSGLRLAVVLDTSASMSDGMLDASKAFTEALVSALGPDDRVAVFAASHDLSPVGPAEVGNADPARKRAILDGLGALVRGGGSDLTSVLRGAMDRLPAEDPNAMVLYVGDGFPSLGELSPGRIATALSRKAGPLTRLGAVAVGPSANTRLLAALTEGRGPLLSIQDSADAAALAVGFLAEAMIPVVADVTLDLGPTVERVYPRNGQVVRRGATAWAVGKLVGPLPDEIVLGYRDGSGAKQERQAVVEIKAPVASDIPRRWASARAAALALEGRGRESVTDAALGVGLLTPWTAWVTRSQNQEYVADDIAARVLSTSPSLGERYGASLFGADADPERIAGATERALGDSFVTDTDAAILIAARRILDGAFPLMRSCRDSRLGIRPDLVGAVSVRLSVDGDGRAKDVKLSGLTARDASFEACLKTVVSNLEYPRSFETKAVPVDYTATFEQPRVSLRGKSCSATSRLPLALRRGIFLERLDRNASIEMDVWADAKAACEVSDWASKRAFVELVLSLVPAGVSGLGSRFLPFATELERTGDPEAARYVRREVLRRAHPNDLPQIRLELLRGEALPTPLFEKQYDAARTPEEKLSVTRRFLSFAPHSPRLHTRILFLLGELGDKPALLDEVRRLREDPFADAALLGDAAELLGAHDEPSESKRTFFEIAERGGNDPWALAFLGDRLRNVGDFDGASVAYAGLEELVPDHPATTLRRALAHEGAKRIDLSSRLLLDLVRTGGRGADANMARIADTLLRSELIDAARSELGEKEKAILAARFAELDEVERRVRVLVRTEASETTVSAAIVRGKAPTLIQATPSASAPQVGVTLLHLDPEGDEGSALELWIPKTATPARKRTARIDVIRGNEMATQTVELRLDGEPVRLLWKAGVLQAP